MTGVRNNFQNLQPTSVPTLIVGMQIDKLLSWIDEYNTEEELLWSQGTIKCTSDENNA